MDLHGALFKLLASLVTGMVVGWSASALTIAGRVDAVEKTLSRIESRLDSLASKK